MQNYLTTYLKGFLMGAADIVPGVSGGTMALIIGIYEKLLTTLAAINLKKPLQSINWGFFIPLGAGILSAIFLLSSLLHSALIEHEGATYAFFLGLILISGLTLLRKITTWNPRTITSLILGIALAYLFIGLNPLDGNHSLLAVFFSGAVAIIAMMLPGVSGSFLLLILGQYSYVLEAIHDRNILVLATLGLGCLAGLLSFSRFLHWLLKNYHNTTLTFLIGMIFGSLRLPIQTINSTQTPMSITLLFAIIGAVIVLTIENLAKRHQATASPEELNH